MRHVIVALALALGPLGPAVCEAVCADVAATPMASMPGCHMTEEGTGPVVTDAAGCRHPEGRLAIVTPVQAATDLGPLVTAPVAAPALRLDTVPAAAALTPSPPLRLPPVPLRR